MRRPSTKKSTLARRYSGKAAVTRGRVQTILFPRSEWPLDDALAWASLNGYKTDDFDVTDTHVRLHQHGRKKARFARTIPFGTNGMRAVVEWR